MPLLSRSTQQYTAFIFGAVLIALLLVIAFAAPNPTPFQYTVFRIVLALAAAGVAAMIPGFLNVEVGTGIRATGAIAVFVIVYFFSPAGLLVTPVDPQPDGNSTTTPMSAPQKASPTEPQASSTPPTPGHPAAAVTGSPSKEDTTENPRVEAAAPSRPETPIESRTPPEPVLIEIKVFFQTTKDNKDHDTKLSMWMKSGSMQIAATERFAGNVEFKVNTESSPFILENLVSNLPKSQIAKGLNARLRMETNGDDNWWFRFKTECLFSDGTRLSMQHPVEERFDDDERVEAEFTLVPQ